jgi:hypothetical protein
MWYLCEMKNAILILFFLSLGMSPPMYAREDASATIAKYNATELFKACGLRQYLRFEVFQKALKGVAVFKPKKAVIAIADMTRSSDQKRFFVIDLEHKKLLLHTLVAHGRNSGERMAKKFSNKPESFKSSKGFFNIGPKIISPKHGLALLLEGLERGINDNARKREIIIHGADYVSETFVHKYGRLGRSHGCPAVPQEVVKALVPIAADGGLLYIHAN